MREVSENEFFRFAVSQTDPHMYSVWESNVVPSWDMNGVLNLTVAYLFLHNENSSVADYVREIVRVRREGALFWVP
ncbi:hypothetical protein D3C76_78020 [compost metagenome]